MVLRSPRYEGFPKFKCRSRDTAPISYDLHLHSFHGAPQLSTLTTNLKSLALAIIEISGASTVGTNTPRCAGLGLPSNTMFLESPEVFTRNGILIRSAVFAQRSRVRPRDRHGDHRQSKMHIRNVEKYSVETFSKSADSF